MSGYVPEFIKKGEEVSYQGKNVKVIDYHFTCPCAVGIENHHPNDDLLMVNLEGIGDTPFSKQDFLPAKATETYVPSDPDCQTC